MDDARTAMAVPSDYRLWAEAARFHYLQYVALGWIEPNDRQVVLEYEPWNEVATFHVAYSLGGEIIGTLRTLSGGYETLPVGRLRPDSATVPGRVVEFASLAVAPERYGNGVAPRLYRSAFCWAVRERADGIVALVDQRLFDGLHNLFGIPFRALGEPRPYLGSHPMPIAASIAEIITEVPINNRRFWNFMCEPLVASDIAWLNDLVPAVV